MPWVREGDCPPERCQGKCCRHIGFWVNPADREWLNGRGLTTVPFGESLLVDIPQVCPHLTQNNLCDIYGKPERPVNCTDWPTEPSHTLLDDCGFSFRWQDEREPVNG